MNISSLSGLTALQQQQNLQKSNAKINAAIAALSSGNKLSSASSDISSLSIASQLQAATGGLKQISANIAQAGSLAQVADAGLTQIQDTLIQLQNVAQQANSPILNDDNRKALGEQFKQLVNQINTVVSGNSFNGKKLLNGDLSGENSISLDSILSSESGDSGKLFIENLSAENLFSGKKPNLLSAENSNDAFTTVGGAINKITGIRANVGSFLQSLDYAAANVDSAIANQEAARSILQDTDFAEASTDRSQATLQQNAAIAIAAQGNRLTPALLKLVG